MPKRCTTKYNPSKTNQCALAHLEERHADTVEVPGSEPGGATYYSIMFYADVAELVKAVD